MKPSKCHKPFYTLYWVPNHLGKTISLRFSKLFLKMFIMGFVGTVVFSTTVCISLWKRQSLKWENQKLTEENKSLRSEAWALMAQLKRIHDNLDKLEKVAHHLQKAASVEATKALIPEKNQVMRPIGPLGLKEYERFKNQHSPNTIPPLKQLTQPLEFQDIFKQSQDLEEKSQQKLGALEKISQSVADYKVKMKTIPTISPVRGWISSVFGLRHSPFTAEIKPHRGIDIAAPSGSAIRCTADGEVLRVGHVSDYGRFIEIRHSPSTSTLYAHTSAIYVKSGQWVRKGEIIGAVGETGRATGPHLHYEIRVKERAVNPIHYIKWW